MSEPTYQLTVRETADYLHAVVTGPNTRENVVAYLDDLLHRCQQRKCRRLLIEERLDGLRLGSSDIYDIASGGADRAVGAFSAIAYVDVNATPSSRGSLMGFAEDVAVNHSLPVRIFRTVPEAEQWLGGGSAPPRRS